jgi:methylated-DNA-protein-cysteine methyltransferase-like protein
MNDFFENVYKVVDKIPKGKVTSYGAIANFLGSRKSARMVGYAMNHSHFLENPIPAHRVVNSQGILSGKHHFGIENEMEILLKKEGIEVKNDKIIYFKSIFWDPNIELL